MKTMIFDKDKPNDSIMLQAICELAKNCTNIEVCKEEIFAAYINEQLNVIFAYTHQRVTFIDKLSKFLCNLSVSVNEGLKSYLNKYSGTTAYRSIDDDVIIQNFTREYYSKNKKYLETIIREYVKYLSLRIVNPDERLVDNCVDLFFKLLEIGQL